MVLGKQGPAVVRWAVIYAVFILPLFLDQPWFLALQFGPILLVMLTALLVNLLRSRHGRPSWQTSLA